MWRNGYRFRVCSSQTRRVDIPRRVHHRATLDHISPSPSIRPSFGLKHRRNSPHVANIGILPVVSLLKGFSVGNREIRHSLLRCAAGRRILLVLHRDFGRLGERFPLRFLAYNQVAWLDLARKFVSGVKRGLCGLCLLGRFLERFLGRWRVFGDWSLTRKR